MRTGSCYTYVQLAKETARASLVPLLNNATAISNSLSEKNQNRLVFETQPARRHDNGPLPLPYPDLTEEKIKETYYQIRLDIKPLPQNEIAALQKVMGPAAPGPF